MADITEVSIRSGCRTMPVVGLGTASYPLSDNETVKSAVLAAIELGYRHFDTAAAYRSEQPLGEAIAEAIRVGLIKSREEVFITTKLYCSMSERSLVVPAIQASLRNLQMEYVDLYLIHWPLRLSLDVRKMPVEKHHILPFDAKSVWEGMEECQTLGLAKAIGVSNFSCKKLDELLSFAKIPPAVNQVEMNPLWHQKKLRDYCKEKGIHITGYCVLGANGTKWGDNRVVGCDVLEDIAKARGKTTAQVSMRWVLEQDVSMVVKSFNKERMKNNLQIFDWSLTEEESKKISQLPQRKGVLLSDMLGPHDAIKEIDEDI